MTLKDYLNTGDRFAAAEVIVSNQEGVHIATFTGQAYTGRIPHSYDSLQ